MTERAGARTCICRGGGDVIHVLTIEFVVAGTEERCTQRTPDGLRVTVEGCDLAQVRRRDIAFGESDVLFRAEVAGLEAVCVAFAQVQRTQGRVTTRKEVADLGVVDGRRGRQAGEERQRKCGPQETSHGGKSEREAEGDLGRSERGGPPLYAIAVTLEPLREAGDWVARRRHGGEAGFAGGCRGPPRAEPLPT